MGPDVGPTARDMAAWSTHYVYIDPRHVPLSLELVRLPDSQPTTSLADVKQPAGVIVGEKITLTNPSHPLQPSKAVNTHTEANQPLRIGRSRACEGSLPHLSVSKSHAEVRVQGGDWQIRTWPTPPSQCTLLC